MKAKQFAHFLSFWRQFGAARPTGGARHGDTRVAAAKAALRAWQPARAVRAQV